MKDILTATSAFQLLIQAAADVIDHRQQGESVGIIQPWMSTEQGVASVLVLMIRRGYDSKFSPKLMAVLLRKYCHDSLYDAYIDYFCQLSGQSGNPLLEKDLRDDSALDVLIDIKDFARRGKSLGWSPSWGLFKEPYASQWKRGFSSSWINRITVAVALRIKRF